MWLLFRLLVRILKKEKEIMTKIEEINQALDDATAADAANFAQLALDLTRVKSSLDQLGLYIQQLLNSPGGISGADADAVIARIKAESANVATAAQAADAAAVALKAEEDADLPPVTPAPAPAP